MFLKLFITVASFLFLTRDAFAAIGLDPNRKDLPVIKPNLENPASTLGIVIQNVITLLFTVGGLAFVIMFIWAAVNWILSGGDKEQIASARRRITTSIIGLIVLSLSFVVMQVVGQILGIGSLVSREFTIPRLLP